MWGVRERERVPEGRVRGRSGHSIDIWSRRHRAFPHNPVLRFRLPRPSSPSGRGPHRMWGVREGERVPEGRVRGKASHRPQCQFITLPQTQES